MGLGANVLTRHSLAYPERVEAMMLVNTCTTKAGWVEWGYQKRNVNHLRTHGITQVAISFAWIYQPWLLIGPIWTNTDRD